LSDETLWHRCNPWWPIRRGEDGRLFLIDHSGQVWRRCIDGRWQYKQDAETLEDAEDRSMGI